MANGLASNKSRSLFPEQSAPFIATHVTQRYMLVGDLGQSLHDYTPKNECFDLWKGALIAYSQMQLETARRGRAAFSFLPDRRLALIPTEAMPIIERCINIVPREGARPVLKANVQWIRLYFSQWAN